MAGSPNGIAIITGANGVFGKFICEGIVRAGYETVCVVRDKVKGEELVRRLQKLIPGAKVRYALVDVSSRQSIEEFTGNLPANTRVDILVNNAAVTPKKRCENSAGIELQWATNVLNYHWMTKYLSAYFSPATRVTNVASFYAGELDLSDPEFKKRRYDSNSAYRASKQANRMMAKAWSEKLAEHGVCVTSCHPGVATSGVSLGLGFDLDRSEEAQRQGAVTPLHCVLSPKENLSSGSYYSDSRVENCSFCKQSDCEKLFQLLEAYK